MSCANCGVTFGEGVSVVESVISTWNNSPDKLTLEATRSDQSDSKDLDKNQHLNKGKESSIKGNTEEPLANHSPSQNRVPIIEALSMIFEISPLRLKLTEFNQSYLNDAAKVFKTCINNCEDKKEVDDNVESNPEFGFCSDCGEWFTLLYNSFRDFVHIIKEDGKLAKKLRELEDQRHFETPQHIKHRGRGRPRKNDQTKDVEIKSAKANTKRRKIRPRDVAFEIQDIVIKPELEDMQISDCDDDFPVYIHSRSSSEDFSPPDSPINMELEESIPRSPRPIRKSSARNKDWASFYKDDDDDDDNFIEDNGIGAGNETEVTVTEAEDDEPDEEVEVAHSNVETISETVQVDWTEEQDKNLEFEDDDSDEDYRPDSDLENLRAEDHRSTRKKRFRKTRGQNREYIVRNIYDCDDCGKVFAHQRSLQIHRRVHFVKSDGLHECKICFKDFPCDDLLKRHRRQFHGEYIPYRMKGSNVDFGALLEEAKKYECPVCHEILFQSDLQTHVNEHKVENPWQCLSCPHAFSTFTDYSRHQASLHNQRPKLACDVCLKQFRSNYHLRNHQTSIHTVRSDTQIDELGSSSEAENQNLDDENVTDKVPAQKPRKHKCTECGKKYLRADQLIEHLIVHGIGDKFQCDVCAREFTHESSKKRHMLLHVDIDQYKCKEDECRKTFSRKDHLVRHMDNIHGIKLNCQDDMALSDTDAPTKTPKAKEVACPYCEKLVKRERMRLHLVTHTGERRHECKECGQKFGLRTTLRTHIQCVHQDLRRYTCNFCDRAFKRSNHLKDHLKLHTEADNKPFQCEQCSRSFRREKNLKSHMVTHYGGKDFMCELCGRSFNRLDNMRAHVKTVHEGIQIRKKRAPSSINRQGPKAKKTRSATDISTKKTEDEEEIKLTPVQSVVVKRDLTKSPELTTINTTSSTKGNVTLESSSITESALRATGSSVTTNKKPYVARKRGNKAKKTIQNEEVLRLPTILNVDGEGDTHQIQVPPHGTIVTLAVDPTMGNVISADGLGLETVHIEEIHGTVEENEAFDSEHDGQRTIVQLSCPPGQVFPSTSDQYQTTTYYQYTYYHQE